MSSSGQVHRGSAREEKVGLLDEQSSSHSDSETSMSDIERPPSPLLNLKLANYSSYTSFLASPLDRIRSAPWQLLLSRFLAFLVPSFLQGRHAREQICPAKLHPTAYLDGMRGLAALTVFFCHFFYQGLFIARSWGDGEDNWEIFKLPIIRLWYQGPAAVCVFFVISGYALSYRPTKLIRKAAFGDFATTMSSLAFRRGIRLYLPTAISTLMIVCMLRLGIYEITRGFAEDRRYMKNIIEPHAPLLESSYAQFRDWSFHIWKFVHVWDWHKFGGSTYYDVHLWTIPVEFRCSLYLFLVLLGTARLRTLFRFISVAGIIYFAYRHSRWEFCLFLSGMVIAEMDHIRGAHSPPSPLPQTEKQDMNVRGWQKRAFWGLMSVVGLWFLSQPDAGGERAPGWKWLTSLIPTWWTEEQYRYYQSFGAVVFVLAVGHCPSWQRFFETPPVQYFGKISYALYLMHSPAMHTVGYMIEDIVWNITGTEGSWYHVGFFLSSIFVVPTVIWWSDVFWRAVDIPTVKFAKWVETKCIY